MIFYSSLWHIFILLHIFLACWPVCLSQAHFPRHFFRFWFWKWEQFAFREVVKWTSTSYCFQTTVSCAFKVKLMVKYWVAVGKDLSQNANTTNESISSGVSFVYSGSQRFIYCSTSFFYSCCSLLASPSHHKKKQSRKKITKAEIPLDNSDQGWRTTAHKAWLESFPCAWKGQGVWMSVKSLYTGVDNFRWHWTSQDYAAKGKVPWKQATRSLLG